MAGKNFYERVTPLNKLIQHVKNIIRFPSVEGARESPLKKDMAQVAYKFVNATEN